MNFNYIVFGIIGVLIIFKIIERLREKKEEDKNNNDDYNNY